LITNHTTDGSWGYANVLKVNQDFTKALVVNNTATNADVFIVYGNGVLCTKKIFAEKIEVTLNAMTSSWYDHVFHPDYNLRSLSELEQFIKQNYHLPEIPSAEEIKENGIDLGDMQGKLLLKIEELTLYTNKQQKLIEDLQKQINELKKQ
jgi:ABC-type Fe3+-hydroxamate transport system substrate-binding protein